MDFQGRSFLKLIDYTPEEIGALLNLAAKLKAKKKGRRVSRRAARQEHRADL